MIEVNQQDFEAIVTEAIDAIPKKYAEKMNNVGFVVEDEPSPEQRQKMHLVNGRTLYGLYEGVPLTQRGVGYNLVLPDKITVFKRPVEMLSNTLNELREQVRYTVWHEVAHHFGLGHEQIYKLSEPN